MSIASVGRGTKDLAFGVGILAAVAGVAMLAAWVYKNRERFNPTSDKNFAYSGTNAVVQVVTGDSTASLGSKIADVSDAVDKATDTVLGWLPFYESKDEEYERRTKAARDAYNARRRGDAWVIPTDGR